MYSNLLYKLLYISTKAVVTIGVFIAPLNPKTRLFYKTRNYRKRNTLAVSIFTCWVVFVWITTIKLWLYHGGEQNPQYHATYGFSCVSLLIFWMDANFYIHQDELVLGLNRILLYFPGFVGNKINFPFL